ncbi:MAG: hypothetical protein HY699_10225 [Deltaproteobacteria bacterium]|nr:hypothetical protein [Deltaproteobacteria bacterium]
MPNKTAGGASLPPDLIFVIQLRPDAAPEHGRLAGRVEHLWTGQMADFDSPQSLLAFVTRVLKRGQGRF